MVNKESSRPKVFLIVNHGWTIRNFLFSDFFSKLNQDCEIFLLSNLTKKDLIEMNLETKGLFKMVPFIQTWLHERITMRRAGYHFALAGTETMKIKSSWAVLQRDYLHNMRVRLETLLMTKVFGSIILTILDILDYYFTIRSKNAEYYKTLFEKIKPDVVFSTFSVIVDERLPLYIAKSMGIKSAVNIVSWDNLSSKGRLPYGIDKYFVWSKLMKKELKDFHTTVEDRQINISGTPQFDFHKNKSLVIDREKFCSSIDFDPNRKFILYSGVTISLMPYEDQLIEELIISLRNNEIENKPQLIIRVHPSDNGNRFDRLIEKYPEVKIIIPGRAHSHSKARSLLGSKDDITLLMSTLYHSEVHINTASTMTLDAAILDKPIINICYEKKPEHQDRSFGVDIYKCTHYKPIIKSEGIKLAYSKKELIEYLNIYLNDNKVDSIGRRKIVSKVCGPVDGLSGSRIADSIISLLE